jgi:hypothetical protein
MSFLYGSKIPVAGRPSPAFLFGDLSEPLAEPGRARGVGAKDAIRESLIVEIRERLAFNV